MIARSRSWLTAAGVAAFALGVVAAAGVVTWLDLGELERAELAAVFSPPRIGLLVTFAIALAAGLAGIVRHWFHRNVEPARRIAEATQLIARSNPDHRLAIDGPDPLRRINEAVNALASERSALQRDVAETVRAAKASVEEEKNRLAALMSELAQSVLVCNREGRMLLYNAAAQSLFRQDAAGGGDTALLGLGRSVFGIIDRNLIAHALETMERQLERGAAAQAQFVTTTHAGGLLRVQAAPVMGQSHVEGGGSAEISGFVLLLADVTETVEAETNRVALMQDLTETSRGGLANIRAAIENLIDYPEMDAGRRTRFAGVIRDEAVRLTDRLNTVTQAFSEQMKARWPLENMRGEDLIALARKRIEGRLELSTELEAVDPDVWVKVDSFSVAQGISYLAARLRSELSIRDLRFRLARGERHAHLDLVWSGAPLSPETAFGWENDPFTVGGEASPLTLKQLMERHGAEAWYRRDLTAQRAYFRLLLPLAYAERGAAASTAVRPEFYDFDLFRRSAAGAALDDRPLPELAYSVFDTETTGLDPAQGDEIISIGAVRIVNGRLLQHETFATLVDPRRPVPEASVAVHGINPDQLTGQPTIDGVLPRFRGFVEDTVLVGHNVAFDMRFLQLKEAQTGVVFDLPVLDTLLLSAVIHPNQETHSLEMIAQRLGIDVVGRHTALGDAVATGEVFLRMIPLLEQAGVRTLGEARAASEKTYYARIKY